MNEITPEEFARLFPNASASTVARNSGPLRQPKDCSAGKFIGVSKALRESHSPSKPKVLATPGMSEMERRLNKTEKRFLARLRAAGMEEANIGIQDVTFRLAFDLRYTPDFRTTIGLYGSSMTFWEVKGGFEREDAAVKIKMAAAKFPYFNFIKAVWKDGRWTETVIRP